MYQTFTGTKQGAGHWRQRECALWELTGHRGTREAHWLHLKGSDQQVHRASQRTGTLWPGTEGRKERCLRYLGLEASLKSQQGHFQGKGLRDFWQQAWHSKVLARSGTTKGEARGVGRYSVHEELCVPCWEFNLSLVVPGSHRSIWRQGGAGGLGVVSCRGLKGKTGRLGEPATFQVRICIHVHLFRHDGGFSPL